MLIQWSEKFATGVESVDLQHKELINQLNRLHDAITSGMGKEVVQRILDFATRYAEQHFAHEESCMDRYRCPMASENRAQHVLFVKRMQTLREQMETHEPRSEEILALYREIHAWIQNHILKVDCALRNCIKTD
jgi:hemerythrin